MGSYRILNYTENGQIFINKDFPMRQNMFIFIAFAFLESV